MGFWDDHGDAIMAIIIVLLIIVVFSAPIFYFITAVKNTVLGVIDPSLLPHGRKLPCGCVSVCRCGAMPDESDSNGLGMRVEKLGGPTRRENAENKETGILDELGYGGGAPWEESIAVTEVDPSVHENHAAFVADVRRFSSGANFTATNDEDGNAAFTNFVGLQRPQHVDILPDARQQPDIDTSVLQRNK